MGVGQDIGLSTHLDNWTGIIVDNEVETGIKCVHGMGCWGLNTLQRVKRSRLRPVKIPWIIQDICCNMVWRKEWWLLCYEAKLRVLGVENWGHWWCRSFLYQYAIMECKFLFGNNFSFNFKRSDFIFKCFALISWLNVLFFWCMSFPYELQFISISHCRRKATNIYWSFLLICFARLRS